MLKIRCWTSHGIENVDVKTLTFPGGELQVNAELHSDVDQIDIVAHLTSAHDIMELLLATDAIRRQASEPIRLFMPYVPYGRQDRVANTGEALSLKVFCKLINAQHYKEVFITDPHSDVTPALLKRCKVISPINRIADIPDLNCMTLVSPDAGARKRTIYAAKALNRPVVFADKLRDTKTGDITGTTIDLSTTDSKASLLVIDDICDGGRTFIELAKAIRAAGHDGSLYLYVTHGIFSRGVEPLLDHYVHIYTGRDWTQSKCQRVTEII